jgi:hypothetical protein
MLGVLDHADNFGIDWDLAAAFAVIVADRQLRFSEVMAGKALVHDGNLVGCIAILVRKITACH